MTHQKITLFVLICIILLTSCKVKKSSNSDAESGEITEIRGGGYSFINPLLDCYNVKSSTLRSYKNLESKLNSYKNESESKYEVEELSIFYRNLSSGEWIGIDEDSVYSPASLLKVPYMIAALKYAQENPEYLNQTILYHPIGDRKVQSLYSEFSLTPGKTYSIERYIQAMVIESDNDAKDIVVNSMPYADYADIFSELGIDIQKYDTMTMSANFISVKDYASFFRILYNATYLNKKNSEYALNILSHTLFNDGIVAGVPKSVVVAHKFGERFLYDSDRRQLHDCGIVYLSGNPYLICVMTKGDDFEKMKNVIAHTSKIIYEHLTQEDNF